MSWHIDLVGHRAAHGHSGGGYSSIGKLQVSSIGLVLDAAAPALADSKPEDPAPAPQAPSPSA